MRTVQESGHDPAALVVVGAGVLALVSLFGAVTQAQAMATAAVVTGVAAIVAGVALSGGDGRRDGAGEGGRRLTAAWLAFLAWAFVCALLSGRVWPSVAGEPTNGLGLLALVAFTALVAFAMGRTDAVARALATAAPVVVVAQVAATLVQLATAANPRGSLPNSTYLGEAVVLLVPFVLIEGGGALPLRRAERIAIAVAAVVVLAAAGSRVAAAVAFFWLVRELMTRIPLAPRVRVLAVAGLVIAVAAGALVFARAEVLGSAGVETLGERPQMWRAAADAVVQRAAVGFGPDGFIAGGVAVTTVERALSEPVLVFRPGASDPHNLLVWVAVSTGIVGLALFIWALVEVAVRWRASARAAAGDSAGAMRAAAWGAGGLFAVALTAPLALQVVPLFALVVGVSLGGPRAASAQSRGAAALMRPVGAWTAVALAALLVANAATRLPLEVHGPEVSGRRARPAQAASDLWRFDPRLAHLASLHWGWVAQVDPAVTAAEPDLVAIERAFALDSRDPFIAFERARTLRFHGATDERIEAAFLDTFARWELYPAARAEYAVFLAQRGRADEAREQLAVAELVSDGDVDRIRAIDTARELLATP